MIIHVPKGFIEKCWLHPNFSVNVFDIDSYSRCEAEYRKILCKIPDAFIETVKLRPLTDIYNISKLIDIQEELGERIYGRVRVPVPEIYTGKDPCEKYVTYGKIEVVRRCSLIETTPSIATKIKLLYG